jgi:hypothetical protein
MMKKRVTLFLSAMAIILLISSPSHALDLVYDGVDIDGVPAQSIITFDSVEPNGLWLFTIKEGGPAVRSDGSVYLSILYIGSSSDGSSLGDGIRAFGLFVYPFLYLFTSSITDYFATSITDDYYYANLIILEYDPFINAARFRESYFSIHMLNEGEYANVWFSSQKPNTDVIYYLHE